MKRQVLYVLLACLVAVSLFCVAQMGNTAEDEEIYQFTIMFSVSGTIEEGTDLINMIMVVYDSPVIMEIEGQGEFFMFCPEPGNCEVYEGSIQVVPPEEEAVEDIDI
jgi:hypothetical protein